MVLPEPGPVDNLVIEDLPLPLEREGWVRIRIEAFGLNRSELMTRLGLSGDAVTFPGCSVLNARVPWMPPQPAWNRANRS